MLIEPDYGYSLNIPFGLQALDDTSPLKLDSKAATQLKQQVGLRAVFANLSTGSPILRVLCAPIPQMTKQEAVSRLEKHYERLISQGGNCFAFGTDKYQKLTDLNASYATNDGYRFLTYVFLYDFRGSFHCLELTFGCLSYEFESNLPTFYSCVKSVNLPDQIPKLEEQKQKDPTSVRLQKVKNLKENGLISE